MKKSRVEYFKLNKNLFISIVVALIVSAAAAQILAEQQDYLNSTYTMLVDLVVFYSTFGMLFYIDNRKKYVTEFGKIDSPRLKRDLLKLVTSIGAGEIAYMAIRWYLQYYLLTLGYEPYLASIITQLVSSAVYMSIINLGVNFTKLYKDGT